MPDRDLADVSWDAQADCEHALLAEKNLVVLLLDYWKFFDAFEPIWVKDFMIALGMDEDLAARPLTFIVTSSATSKSMAPLADL